MWRGSGRTEGPGELQTKVGMAEGFLKWKRVDISRGCGYERGTGTHWDLEAGGSG